MKTSDQIDKIVEALAKAQGQMQNPENNKTVEVETRAGRSYKYSYATLNSVYDTARKALSENGLAHTAGIHYDNGVPILIGMLMHTSGQWFGSHYMLPRTNDDKAFAASMTYGRRYLFNALVGIAGDEDLDSEPEDNSSYGNKGLKPKSPPISGHGPVVQSKPGPQPKPPQSEITSSDKQRLSELSKRRLWAIESVTGYMKLRYGRDKLSELTRHQFNELIDVITHRNATEALESLKAGGSTPTFDEFDKDPLERSESESDEVHNEGDL
jgi:hypothetical protein